MEKCLLSIDWDYFVYTKENWGSYTENKKSLIDFWYKRYLNARFRGIDIEQNFGLTPEVGTFWAKIKKRFYFEDNIKVYVSDSHALSYKAAKERECNAVYLFDSHSDLGYGGLSALDFEVNCSNWLGKLFKDKYINKAFIIYSPHTAEKPECFQPINRIYNIKYCKLADFNNKKPCVSTIHISRSGAWTPPWLDGKFNEFVKSLGIPYELTDCPHRPWDPDHITLSDEINYLLA
jgi:hypothetical protein